MSFIADRVTDVFNFVKDLPHASPWAKVQAAAVVGNTVVGALSGGVLGAAFMGGLSLATVTAINTPSRYETARAHEAAAISPPQ